MERAAATQSTSSILLFFSGKITRLYAIADKILFFLARLCFFVLVIFSTFLRIYCVYIVFFFLTALPPNCGHKHLHSLGLHLFIEFASCAGFNL